MDTATTIHTCNTRRAPSLGRRIIALCCIASLVLLPLQHTFAVSPSMEYYHYDKQGSLLEVYDEDAKRLLSQTWSPWGQRDVVYSRASGGHLKRDDSANLLLNGLPAYSGYTGHKEILSTGLTFAGDNRLYHAGVKRFLNSDDRTTGGIQGENRYSYAYNNPLSYVDPDGHIPVFAAQAATIIGMGVLSVAIQLRRTMAVGLKAGFKKVSGNSRISMRWTSKNSPKSIQHRLMLAASSRLLSAWMKVSDYLAPEVDLAPDMDLYLFGAAFAGIAFTTIGIADDRADFLSAGSTLLASPIRSLAAINKPTAQNNFWRNAAWVFGGNIAGAIPGLVYKGVTTQSADKVIDSLMATVFVSTSILLSDRLFAAPGGALTLPLCSLKCANAQSTLRKRRFAFSAVISTYSAIVFTGLHTAGKYTGAADPLKKAAMGATFPLSFLLQAANMNDIVSAAGPGIRSKTFFQLRFIMGAVAAAGVGFVVR